MAFLVYHIIHQFASRGVNFIKNLLMIFKWNFKRFFAKPSNDELFLEERWQDDSFCAAVISSTVKRRGRKWLIPVNLTLFLLGLFLLIADDYIEAHTLSFMVHMITVTVACAFLILKFDAWKIRDNKNVLKLMYICCMCLTGGYAALTYLFLIIYENVVALGYCGGV